MAAYQLCAGSLEIQGLSSGQVTLPVLLAVGSGLDQTIISPSGQREQKQADRQTAGPWTQRRKALLTSGLYAV